MRPNKPIKIPTQIPILEPLESRILFTATDTVVHEAVTALFRDLLHRAPDAASLDFFSSELTNRTSVGIVARQLADSDEYLGNQVDAIFQQFLHRRAAAADRAAFTYLMRHSGTPLTVEALVSTSPEYVNRAGGDRPALINQLYHDFLHRAPDAGGFAAFSTLLQQGAPGTTLGWRFAYTTESVGFVIDDLYQNILGRPADAAGKAAMIQGLQTIQPLQNLVQTLAGSEEYAHNRINPLGSPDEVWFKSAIQDLLGRSATDAEVAQWVPQLDIGFPRADTILAFIHSPEYGAARAASIFQQFLHRAPDAASLANYANLVMAGTSEREIIQMLVSSPDYYANAGGTVVGYAGTLSRDLFGAPASLSTLLSADVQQAISTNAQWAKNWLAYEAVNNDAFYAQRLADFYTQFMHRPADSAGIANFTQAIQSRQMDFREVILYMLSSDEYFDAR